MQATFFAILQILIIVFVPYGFMRFSERSKWGKYLSPIVLCFALGIFICTFNIFPIDQKISELFRDGSIAFALPLLLYSSNIQEWLHSSKKMLISFGLCLVSGFFATILASFLFTNQFENVWQISGMLTGIFTGGTANLFAVGIALEAPNEDMILLNSAEIFWGALYLLFLLSFAKPLWNKLLPKSIIEPKDTYHSFQESNFKIADVLKGFGLTIFIIVVIVLISQLIFQSFESNFIVIGITTLGIIASLNPTIRNWSGTFEAGDYMLLMFGLAIGMISDFSVLLEKGEIYIAFVGLVLLTTAFIHGLLCRWRKIDTDTYLITSTAALYGPVFIGQVASAMKNRGVILGGLIVSLVGLAIGTYMGLGVAYFVKYFV